MTRAPANPSRDRGRDDASPDAERPTRRVILVGRTGLDQSLRRDRSIELVRAGDSLSAIGELADPIDADSPAGAVVIVAPGAQPEPRERAPFVEALRLIEPGVSVLLATTGAGSPEYDGVVSPDASARDLDAALAAVSVGARVTARDDAEPVAARDSKPDPQPDSELDSEPGLPEIRTRPQASMPGRTPVPAAHAPSAAALGAALGSDPGDTPVLQAVLRGADPTPRALERIRARLGREDIVYEPATRSVPAPAGLVCPVRAGVVTIGHLVVRDAGPAEEQDEGFARALEAHAEWLAAWVRLHEQQRSLRLAAFTDPLTGAWNRRYFDRYLGAAIEQVRVARLPLTVLVFDIDDFKAYNDRYGHAAGDEILTETVRLLRSVIRPSDRVCRIGGDEFAVIFYEPTGPRSAMSRPPESIYRLATRFQNQIVEHRFPKLGAEAQGTLTISGGLATYPWDGTDAESLLRRADELSMRSKRQGKNVITLGPGAESVCKDEPKGT